MIEESIKVTNEDTTLLIPFYNTPMKYFIPCIKSAVKSGAPILLVDDGSAPESLAELEAELKNHDNSNIDFHKLPENRTVVAVFRYMRDFVKTKFVTRLDSDDLISLNIAGEYADIIGTQKKMLDYSYLVSVPTLGGVTIRKDIFFDAYDKVPIGIEKKRSEDVAASMLILLMTPNVIRRMSNTRYKYIYRENTVSTNRRYVLTRRESRLYAIDEAAKALGGPSQESEMMKRIVMRLKNRKLDEVPKKGI